MKKQKFMRTDFRKYSKLGVRRKNKQKYRKAKGIDNKMRLKMKGHLRNVSVGFRSNKKGRGLVQKLKPILINNLKELKNISKEEIGIIAKIGSKKRREILDYAIKNNIKLSIDPKKALEKIENNLKKSKEKKEKRNARKIESNKKAKKEAEKKAKQESKEEKEEIKKEKATEVEKLEVNNSQKSKEKTTETDKPVSNEISSEQKSDLSKKIDSNKDIKKNKKEIKSNNYGRGN